MAQSAIGAPLARAPLTGGALVALTAGVALATFMEVLDISIVNVSVRTIAGNLGVSNTEGTMAISAYSMASAIVQPLTGWISRRFGEVKTFAVSVALFVVFSVLCGLANSMTMLIVFRLLQGAVSGPMVPLSQSILLNNYPPAKRPLALALWAMMVVVAPVFGPIMGGWITDNYSWAWIFFINIPIGLFALTISLHCALYNRSITQSYQILGTSLEDTIVVAIRSTNELSKQLLASYGDVVYQIIDVSKDSTGKPVAYDLLTLKKYVKKG